MEQFNRELYVPRTRGDGKERGVRNEGVEGHEEKGREVEKVGRGGTGKDIEKKRGDGGERGREEERDRG